MEFEFDKEIDILLRQAAHGSDAAAKSVGVHPDADEINAFAENVLSEKSRLRAMEHFADCPRCRKILSNLIALNHEPESEIVHTAKDETIPAAAAIPWYKKLFMFPQIAYAMGALALIFGGIIAFIVLKDSTQNYSSDLAQTEKQSESPDVFSGGTSANSNANMASSAANYSNSTAMSNAASSANSNSLTALPTPEAKPNQPTVTANSAAPESQDKTVEAAKPAPKPVEKTSADTEVAVKEKRDDASAAAPPPAASKKENAYTLDGVTTDADAARQQTELSQNQTSNQTQIMPNSRSVQNLPMTRRVPKSREEEALSGSAANAADENKSAETKSLSGKNFRRTDGVWYDITYRNQPTINLRRSSDEYKKLDANLRSIADKLGGVVVIVSGNKAYRIQ